MFLDFFFEDLSEKGSFGGDCKAGVLYSWLRVGPISWIHTALIKEAELS